MRKALNFSGPFFVCVARLDEGRGLRARAPLNDVAKIARRRRERPRSPRRIERCLLRRRDHDGCAQGGGTPVASCPAGASGTCESSYGASANYRTYFYPPVKASEVGAKGAPSGAGKVVSLEGVTAISAGFTDTCAFVPPSSIECWGEFGELGDGTTVDRATPVLAQFP